MYTVILSSPDWREAAKQYTRKATAIKAAEKAFTAGYVYLNSDIELSKKDREFIVEKAFVLDSNGNYIKSFER